ncbi:hypothetical protein ACN2MM_06210 [Alkalilimnicola ehrlichii MLHE-1]|nr:hypothetical protein [Alkalilimnicola ehrlichii]
MAFHTPDPKLRAVEQRNAELRAQAFAACFRWLRRGLSRVTARMHRAVSVRARKRGRGRNGAAGGA